MRSFLHNSKIEDVLQPLQQKMGIDHFAYHRSYGNEGEVVTDDVVKLNKWLGDPACHMPKDVSDNTGMIDWGAYHSKKCMTLLSEEFDFNPHGVTFLFKHEDGLYEHLALATKNRQIDLLQDFALHPEKAQQVISHVRNQIHSNQGCMSWYSYKKKQKKIPNVPLDALSISESRKIFVYGLRGEAFVTRSELRCLTALLKLKSIKEISVDLDCSVKTIDCHISKLKKKLGFSNRHELYKIAVSNCLI